MPAVAWNIYARNHYFGEVTALNAISAMEIACEIWKKYNLIIPELSVIQVNKERFGGRLQHWPKIETCTDYRIKYPC